MKLAVALLLITTSFGAGSVAVAAGQGLSRLSDPNLASRTVPALAMTLIDDDREEEEEDSDWSQSEDDEEDDCDEDDEDDDCAPGGASNAAKAGTAAPPKNGLFTNGTAPVVKSN